LGRVFEAVYKALKDTCPEFKDFPTRRCLEHCGLFKVCETIKNFAKIRGRPPKEGEV